MPIRHLCCRIDTDRSESKIAYSTGAIIVDGKNPFTIHVAHDGVVDGRLQPDDVPASLKGEGARADRAEDDIPTTGMIGNQRAAVAADAEGIGIAGIDTIAHMQGRAIALDDHGFDFHQCIAAEHLIEVGAEIAAARIGFGDVIGVIRKLTGAAV